MKDSDILEVIQRVKDSPFKDVNEPILTMNEDGSYSYKLLNIDQLKEELIKVNERVNVKARELAKGLNTITTNKYVSSSTCSNNFIYTIIYTINK